MRRAVLVSRWQRARAPPGWVSLAGSAVSASLGSGLGSSSLTGTETLGTRGSRPGSCRYTPYVERGLVEGPAAGRCVPGTGPRAAVGAEESADGGPALRALGTRCPDSTCPEAVPKTLDEMYFKKSVKMCS